MKNGKLPQSLLITTKLKPPAVKDNLVQRPRLISRLKEYTENRLTLISAPAGYGKTTLAAQWMDQNRRLSAWLSVDKYDLLP